MIPFIIFMVVIGVLALTAFAPLLPTAPPPYLIVLEYQAAQLRREGLIK